MHEAWTHTTLAVLSGLLFMGSTLTLPLPTSLPTLLLLFYLQVTD